MTVAWMEVALEDKGMVEYWIYFEGISDKELLKLFMWHLNLFVTLFVEQRSWEGQVKCEMPLTHPSWSHGRTEKSGVPLKDSSWRYFSFVYEMCCDYFFTILYLSLDILAFFLLLLVFFLSLFLCVFWVSY